MSNNVSDAYAISKGLQFKKSGNNLVIVHNETESDQVVIRENTQVGQGKPYSYTRPSTNASAAPETLSEALAMIYADLESLASKADNNTTYTFTGGQNDGFKVTPSGGSEQTVVVKTNLSGNNLVNELPVSKGGTGATSASGARTNLGLGSAAEKNYTTDISNGSASLITSGAVYSMQQTLLNKINALATNYVVKKTNDSRFNIARGSSTGTLELQTGITDFRSGSGISVALSSLKVGDNVYVVETDVKDWWVGSINATTGYVTLYELESDAEGMVTQAESWSTANKIMLAGGSGTVKSSSKEFAAAHSGNYDSSAIAGWQNNSDIIPSEANIYSFIYGILANYTTDNHQYKLVQGSSNNKVKLQSNGGSGSSYSDVSGSEVTITDVAYATAAGKLNATFKLTVGVNSGKKSNGTTDISGSNYQNIDGSAAKTITVTLGDSGVTAGTYSAVQVNAKGIVVGGFVNIAYVEKDAQGNFTVPSNLVDGGTLFVTD